MFVVLTENVALVYHGARDLSQHLMPSVCQFPSKSSFVCLLFQSAPKFGMDFNGGIDYLARQVGINA